MSFHRLFLQLPGTAVEVRADDKRWSELVHLLWRPFVVADEPEEAVQIEVGLESHGWMARRSGQPITYSPDPWVVASDMRNALMASVWESMVGSLCLHAGVVAKDGIGLLLVGPPGAGKTTLVIELARRGWNYCSDDVAPVRPGTSEVVSVPKPLVVKDPGCWEVLAPLWRPPEWLPRPEVLFLLPPTAFSVGGGFVDARYLVFLDFAPQAPSGLEEVSAGMAAALAGTNSRGGQADLKALARLCRQARSARLRYGSPSAAIRLLGGWMEGKGLHGQKPAHMLP